MVLGDGSLIIWFVLLVSSRSAIESNDGQGRAVIEAQELKLGLEQIELGQTQIGDVLLTSIENNFPMAVSGPIRHWPAPKMAGPS